MVNGGIFGPKLSGKTTLARALARAYYVRAGRRALVFDPHLEPWGNHAFVTADEEKFWPVVWRETGYLVVVEEAAATIRRERELVPVFTRLRHNNHKLLVIGHSGMDLLPVMRQQLDEIYLFRQPEKAAVVWAETFCEDGLLDAQKLRQFEFLRCRLYEKPRKFLLSKS